MARYYTRDIGMGRFESIKLIGSPLVPEGQLTWMSRHPWDRTGALYFHERRSTRHRFRRRHGRARNAPRRRVTTVTLYHPDYDKLKEMYPVTEIERER